MGSRSFKNCRITFATNHGKAQAAQTHFERILSAHIDTLIIDSDSLGTFTGEVERPGSMLDALRGKIRLARTVTDCELVLVSEGSFSSADGFGLLTHGIEMLMLHDAQAGVEIVEQYISYETNYATATIGTLDDLHAFLTRISFGSHAVVLYPEGVPLRGNVKKGITDGAEADQEFTRLRAISPSHTVIAMSDMRAHLNPTRMRAIGHCCELLAKRLITVCSQCGSGGFGLSATLPGLPCEACGLPTQRSRGEKHSCPFCRHSIERPRSDGVTTASAAECDWCNP